MQWVLLFHCLWPSTVEPLTWTTFNKMTTAIFFNCLNSIASPMIISLHWFPIFCIYIAATQGLLRTLACHYCPTVLNWCVDGYVTHYSSNLVLDWIHLSCCWFLVSTNLWQQNPACADANHLLILCRCFTLLYDRNKNSIAHNTKAFLVTVQYIAPWFFEEKNDDYLEIVSKHRLALVSLFFSWSSIN